MKSIILTINLILTSSSYASSKICFWSGGHDGEKGDRVAVKIDEQGLEVKKSGRELEYMIYGTAPRIVENDVVGKDGFQYMAY